MMTIQNRFELTWIREEFPGFDSTGTIAESWFASVGRYAARIDHFTEENGAGYAYTVEFEGNPVRHGENESADSKDAAEAAVLSLLVGRIPTPPFPWQSLSLFDSDNDAISAPERIHRALAEFRETGGMRGVFFNRMDLAHENAEDASTWGPASADDVDWSGF